MNIEIGPYILTQRTEYSKIQVINRNGKAVDKDICEKIVDDYIKQTTMSNKYFKIIDNKLKFAEFDDIDYLFIPDEVEEINDNALNSSSFKYVHFPDTLKTIGLNAFKECENLIEIELPNSVNHLSEGVFHSCKNLEKVILPNTLDIIPRFAFAWCDSLKNIILPNTMMRIIDSYAFYKCKSLEKINMPRGLMSFGDTPFAESAIKVLSFNKDFPGYEKYGNFLQETMISKIEISKEVNYITPELFKKTHGIVEINYAGNKQDFSKFKKENKAFLKSLKGAKINLINNLENIIKENEAADTEKNYHDKKCDKNAKDNWTI